MYVPLSDAMTCPRCGPEHSLIMLADRVAERRVYEASFGCPNCRGRFPVTGGFGDLRPEPETELPGAEGEPGTGEEAMRLAALLGVARGPGYVLVAGPAARMAPGIVALVEDLEVVAIDEALAGWAEEPGISRLATGATLPFQNASMRGVALSGDAVDLWLEEGARVLGGRGRLVLEEVPEEVDGIEERLAGLGFSIAAREGRTLVAVRR